jgi:hypothetical protein
LCTVCRLSLGPVCGSVCGAVIMVCAMHALSPREAEGGPALFQCPGQWYDALTALPPSRPEQEARAYGKLRIERANARLVGVRAKKVKDAATKEEEK